MRSNNCKIAKAGLCLLPRIWMSVVIQWSAVAQVTWPSRWPFFCMWWRTNAVWKSLIPTNSRVLLLWIFCWLFFCVLHVKIMGLSRKLLLSCDLSICFLGGYTRLQGGRWSDSRALSCVERFDTFSHYWTTVSSLRQARSGLGVAVVGGMVYAIGGKTWNKHFGHIPNANGNINVK